MERLLAYAWYFFIYSFLGWCAEVVFAAFKNGAFVNRGFLCGPVCPIYGSGLVLVLGALHPLEGNLLWLYLGSAALTTLIELVTGFAMEKLFHHRWWDYRKMPLNIGGYVCLPFSLIWGAACVAIVKLLHPPVARLVAWIPHDASVALLSAFAAVFLLDVVVTVMNVLKLNRSLAQLDDLTRRMRGVSDTVGGTLAGGALRVKALDERVAAGAKVRYGQLAQSAQEERETLEMRLRREQISLTLLRDQRRLLRAFPQIRSLRHEGALAQLMARLPARARKGAPEAAGSSSANAPAASPTVNVSATPAALPAASPSAAPTASQASPSAAPDDSSAR